MVKRFKTVVTQKQRWLGLVPLISLSGITCLLLGSQSFAAISEQIAPRIAQQRANSNEAEQIFQEALQLYQQGTAESLRQAIPKLEQLALLYRQAGDKRSEAESLLLLGNVYNNLGEKQKALEVYNQALPLYRAVGDRRGEATVLNFIGWVYDDLDEKQKALEYYQQALQLAQVLGDQARQASILSNIGLVYSNSGEQQQALDYYQQSLQLAQGIDLGSGEGSLLNNIGLAYWSLGDKQKALEYYQQALSIFRAEEDRFNEATTLNNIGLVYSELGEQQQALDHFNQALALHQTLGNLYGEAVTLSNIGLLYLRLGSYQQAIDYLNQALPLRQTVGDRSGEATTLNNIGGVYNDLGEYQQALNYYNRSLLVFKSVGNRIGEAYALSNIGGIYLDLGDQQQALDYHSQALLLHQTVENRSGEAITLINIGFVYNDLGDKHRALEYYQQALPIFRTVGDRAGEASSLNSIARVEHGLGNLQTAVTQIQAAIDIIENLRTKIDSQELRTSYFARNQAYYQLYIDLLMQQHQQTPNQGYDALALHVSERARARSLLEQLTEAGLNLRADLDPALLAEEQRLTQALNAADQKRLDLLNSSYSNNDLEAVKAEIDAILQQLQRLEAQIRQANPAYANLRYPDPLVLADIQSKILDDKTLLLQYALGDERSYLFLVSKTSLKTYTLPPKAEIETAVEAYRALLQSPSFTDLSQGQQLSQMLLGQLADELTDQRLVIVGDGKLQLLPFAALPWGSGTSPAPLLANHEIITLPSVTSLAVQREQWQQRPQAPKTLAVLADPVFTANDPRLGENARTIVSGDLSREPSLVQDPVRNSCGDFARLPYTAAEAEQILALVPAAQQFSALGFDANHATATAANLNQYQIVHLATHGCIQDNPLLSNLALSFFQPDGQRAESSSLKLQDIYNLELNAELVVLSACQTGTGKEVQGEGIVGLTRGFMYAGARRIVVSLWSVNDRATSTLMGDYYRQMLQQGRDPAAALQQAQLAMWQSGNNSAPYYWAPFTIQGDW